MKLISILLISLSIIVAAFLIKTGLIEFNSVRTNSVDVKGISERTVKANFGAWTINFNVEGDSFEQALKKHQKNIQDIDAFLKEQGFEDKNISYKSPKTSAITPDKDKNPAQGGKTIYQINSKVEVHSEDVDLIEKASSMVLKLLEKNIALDAGWEDRINPRYYLENFDQLRPEMIAEAVKSGKAMAQKFAEDAGLKFGDFKSGNQGQFTIKAAQTGDNDHEKSIMKKVRVVSHLTFNLA